jgi:PAS domain S-box-containing protein
MTVDIKSKANRLFSHFKVYSKREFILIIFLSAVFVFLTLSIVFSQTFTFSKQEETIHILTNFSEAENSLSTLQLNINFYVNEQELQNLKKAKVALTDLKKSTKNLESALQYFSNKSDTLYKQRLSNNLNGFISSANAIVTECENFLSSNPDIVDYQVFNKKLNSEIGNTLSSLDLLKKTYRKSVDNELEVLKSFQIIRIVITTNLFVAIIIWLGVYIRRNKKHQQQIRESEAKFRGIFKSSPLGIFHYDSDSVITEFNERFVEILGSTHDLLKGLNIFERVNDEELVEAVRESLIDGVGFYENLYNSLTSGKQVFVRAHFKGIRNEENNITEGVGIVEDISEIKKVEAKLKNSLFKNRAIISAMPDTLLNISGNGTFIDFDPLVNKDIVWLPNRDNIRNVADVFPEEVASLSLKKIEQTLKTGEMQVFEFELNNGESKHYLETRMVKSSDSSVLAIVRDITESKKNAELLKASQERYETFINETKEGIYRIEFIKPIPVDLSPNEQARLYYKHGYFAEVNKALVKMYGAEDVKELVGQKIKRFHNPKENEENFQQTVNLMRNKFTVEDQKTKEVDKNGEIHYFINNAFGIVENDHLIRIWGTQRDVTKLVETQEEKEVLQKAVEQSQVSIVITDTSGNIEYVNPKFEDVTGYTLEEVIGKNPRLLKSGLTDQSLYFELWSKISNGENWSGIFHNKKKNGELFFESASISPITDDMGNIKHYVAVKEDITELTKAQLELKNYKEYLEDVVEKRTEELKNRNIFLRALIDTIPNPVFVKDRNKKYTDVNKAFVEMFNKNFDELIGFDVNKIATKDFIEKAEKTDNILLESHDKQVFETVVNVKGHSELPVMVYKASFGPADKKPEGIVGLIIDISESKKIQEQISQALEREKELNEMKTNFISLASHELRTPLTAIYSSTELIEKFGRKWPENKYLSHIERIKFSVEGLTNLMEDLLTLSRVDTGKIEFSPRLLNLQTLVENGVASLEPLKTDTHQLNLDINLKSKFYSLDERLLKYIIQNLLSNAIKYSPQGGEILFKVYDDEDNIYMKIRDEGIGIPEEDFAILFEPFHRGKNVGSILGTGLGLSIVKEAVTLHKGHIEVQSEVNKFTEFSITIPIIN